MKSIYFPGLNTIRLYAAFGVIIFHVYPLGLEEAYWIIHGIQAVYLFFVLSGFLISYLMIEERERTGRIDVKGFYIRRTLRILPLYYLVVFFAYLFPAIAPMPFLPYALTMTAPVGHNLIYGGFISHVWSIGVEEVFYLLFPLLVSRWGFVRVCAGILIWRALVELFGSETVRFVLQDYRFEAMAIGGLAAWVLYYRPAWMRAVYHPVVAWGTFGVFLLINFQRIYPQVWVASLVYIAVIVNIATNPRFPKFEHPLLSWLGQRTYGIYLWHYPLTGILASPALGLEPLPGVLLVVVLTIAVSAVSYRYFELPFIRLRRHYRPAPPANPASGQRLAAS